MKFSPPQPLSKFVAAFAVLLLAGLNANAQEIGQNWFGEAYSRSSSDVDSLYHSNSQRPLGGLFAPGFTRTLTILGGLNFPSAGTDDVFDASPGAGISSAALPGGSGTAELDETGYAISFAFGRRHSHRLRSEIEVAVRGNDIISATSTGLDSVEQSTGSVDAVSLMKNFIIEFNNNSRFTPYAGAGLGLSYIEVEQDSGVLGALEADETLFSYQAIGGVATKLSAAADFIVEYRFFGTSDVEFEELGQSITYNTSNLFFGVKFEY